MQSRKKQLNMVMQDNLRVKIFQVKKKKPLFDIKKIAADLKAGHRLRSETIKRSKSDMIKKILIKPTRAPSPPVLRIIDTPVIIDSSSDEEEDMDDDHDLSITENIAVTALISEELTHSFTVAVDIPVTGESAQSRHKSTGSESYREGKIPAKFQCFVRLERLAFDAMKSESGATPEEHIPESDRGVSNVRPISRSTSVEQTFDFRVQDSLSMPNLVTPPPDTSPRHHPMVTIGDSILIQPEIPTPIVRSPKKRALPELIPVRKIDNKPAQAPTPPKTKDLLPTETPLRASTNIGNNTPELLPPVITADTGNLKSVVVLVPQPSIFSAVEYEAITPVPPPAPSPAQIGPVYEAITPPPRPFLKLRNIEELLEKRHVRSNAHAPHAFPMNTPGQIQTSAMAPIPIITINKTTPKPRANKKKQTLPPQQIRPAEIAVPGQLCRNPPVSSQQRHPQPPPPPPYQNQLAMWPNSTPSQINVIAEPTSRTEYSHYHHQQQQLQHPPQIYNHHPADSRPGNLHAVNYPSQLVHRAPQNAAPQRSQAETVIYGQMNYPGSNAGMRIVDPRMSVNMMYQNACHVESVRGF